MRFGLLIGLIAVLSGCGGPRESAVQNVIKTRLNTANVEFGEFTLLERHFACIGAAETYGDNRMLQYSMMTDADDHWVVLSADAISHSDCVMKLKESMDAAR